MAQIGKFETGQWLTTPGAWSALREAGNPYAIAFSLLARHVSGDWGDLDPEDKLANERALQDRSRLVSAYVLKTGQKVWVITEASDDSDNRPATTFLLPGEY